MQCPLSSRNMQRSCYTSRHNPASEQSSLQEERQPVVITGGMATSRHYRRKGNQSSLQEERHQSSSTERPQMRRIPTDRQRQTELHNYL
jgi:hypothetical protein